MRKLKILWRLLKHRKAVSALLSSHLSLLESDGVADALGGLTSEEEEGVTDALRAAFGDAPAESGSGGSTVIEFGTLFGLTTQLLAEAAPSGTTILTVDNFCWNPFGLPPNLHRRFTERILRPYLSTGRVKLIGCDSATFRERYDGIAPALVFLDADHGYAAVRDEIAWAKEKAAGVISGHDYGNPLFGVTRAVDEAFPDGVKRKGMVWWRRYASLDQQSV